MWSTWNMKISLKQMIQGPQKFRVEDVVRVESEHSFDLFRREICPSVELNLYGNLRPLRFCEAKTLALAWCLTSSLIIIRKSDEKTWRNISSRNDVGVARQCERMLNEKDVSITMKYESNSSQRLEHSEHCKLCTLWHVPTLAIVLMSAAAAASCFPCLEGIFVSTSARVFHVARDFFYVLSTFPALMTKHYGKYVTAIYLQ